MKSLNEISPIFTSQSNNIIYYVYESAMGQGKLSLVLEPEVKGMFLVTVYKLFFF